MIKVVYKYKTKTSDLDELKEKFALSADPKFSSDVKNIKIEMFSRIDGDETIIVLDIYYDSLEDYETRSKFEGSLSEWNDIWFNPNNKHTEESVEVLNVL